MANFFSSIGEAMGGAAVPLTLIGAALAASDISDYNSQKGQIKVEKSQNNLEASQQNLAFSQKTLDNIASTQQMIAKQAVAASGMGEALNSGSVQAASFDTFQKGKQQDKYIQTEQATAEASYEAKQAALDQKSDALPWQFIGNLANTAVTVYGAA